MLKRWGDGVKAKAVSSLRGLPRNCSIGHESRHRKHITPAAMFLSFLTGLYYTLPNGPLGPLPSESHPRTNLAPERLAKLNAPGRLALSVWQCVL